MESVRESLATANSAPAVNSVPPFLSKTYDMVDDSSTNDIVSWSSGNNSFVVWNVPEFAKQLLPKYFKHNNFSSFVRQLNTYGFRKVDPDRWEFANEGFLRGQKHLLKTIVRRKPSHAHNQQQPQVQSSSTGACVEVGKFGLEEEVERLKRDKNVLMQELVRLRQQQQTTEHQLQSVGQKVQVMEQRQQQMMSFLAKAVQSPGFLNQLVQQQNESNRLMGGNNKKRRLPREDQEKPSVGHVAQGPNGQIVKFQPSMNEAAKAMVREMLKMSSSPRFENFTNNSGSFLLDDIPSSDNMLDNGSSSNRVSGVTLSEVAPISCTRDQIPETNVLHPQADQILPNLGPMQGTNVRQEHCDLIGIETGNEESIVDPISAVLDGSMALDSDDLSPDDDMNELLADVPKLPGINDSFWEQFFAASPLTGDTDEINSTSIETDLGKEYELPTDQHNGWDKNQPMDHLTAQMSLLTSDAQIH